MYDRRVMPGWGNPETALPAEMRVHLDRTADEPTYAGFWRRFLAASIDRVVLTVPFYAGQVFLPAVLNEPAAELLDDQRWWLAILMWLAAYLVLPIVIEWLYYAGFESSSRQATLGKLALGVVVTDLAGQRISLGRATGRYVAHYLTLFTLLIGDLIQPFTRRRQALHDILAGTLVVRT